MNKKYKALLAAALVSPMLLTTSCIDEVEPTNGVIQEQLESNAKATEAIVWGMSSHLNQCPTITEDQAYDWGYGSIMHSRDVMGEDLVVSYSGYDWYQSWSTAGRALNEEYMICQFSWLFFSEQVLMANNAIKAIAADVTDTDLMALRGAALGFRAATYLDMARSYEFLPNNYQSSVNRYNHDVTGYTVPIVTEKTTEEQSRNNPRVTHDVMVKFIIGDLEEAVNLFTKSKKTVPAKTLPSLGVIYGLLARTYLWDASYTEENLPYQSGISAMEAYQKAADYAQLAIEKSGATPLTRDEWLSTTNGFNDLSVSSWMWGMQYSNEDRAVTSGLLNWTSWMSNETSFGYASAGPFLQISASLYDQISDRDFRKLSYVAPEGSPLSGQEKYVSADLAEELEFGPYYSLKFRPGSGNIDDNLIACSVGVPLMRVEEMYLIKAEAIAHINPTEGATILRDFMQKYRNSSYRFTGATTDDVVAEVILQKRVELWGEGQIFFDYKRLNLDITRSYRGTNFDNAAAMYNTTGRPAWMNYVIVRSEGNNNKAVTEWNNPPCGSVMTPVQ